MVLTPFPPLCLGVPISLATTIQIVESPPAAELDLLVDDDDDHGKCSVIFVGIVPSAAQKLQLQDYSRKFDVRLAFACSRLLNVVCLERVKWRR